MDMPERTLAIGATRPALFPYLGIPWVDFLVFCMAAMEAAVIRPQFLIPIGVAFAGSLILYRQDYNAGRVFICWTTTTLRHLAAHTFGGTFISASEPHRAFRGIGR